MSPCCSRRITQGLRHNGICGKWLHQRSLMSLENNYCSQLHRGKNNSLRSFSSLSTLLSASHPSQQSGASAQHQSPTTTLPQIIPTKGVPIHLYADEIEPQAMAQIMLLAKSPLPVDYVSVMPDAHLGKGVTIGTVFASEEYVCPNAVGVDIGCGMVAVPICELFRNQLTDEKKNEIFYRLKERIPTGFAKHDNMLPEAKTVLEEITEELRPTDYVKDQLLMPRVTDQLGTLGGGNHFLEIVHCDRDDQIWSLLHSGSRNIGNRVAQHYDSVAKNILQQKGVNTRKLNGIHYMPIKSQEGQDYLRDMEWCQRYAFENQQAMQQIMLQIIADVTKHEPEMNRSVNIHHNYCQCEDCGNG